MFGVFFLAAQYLGSVRHPGTEESVGATDLDASQSLGEVPNGAPEPYSPSDGRELETPTSEVLDLRNLLGINYEGLPKKEIVQLLSRLGTDEAYSVLLQLYRAWADPREEQPFFQPETYEPRLAILKALANYGDKQQALTLLVAEAEENTLSREDRCLNGRIAAILAPWFVADNDFSETARRLFVESNNPRVQGALIPSLTWGKPEGATADYLWVYQESQDRELRAQMLGNVLSFRDPSLALFFVEEGSDNVTVGIEVLRQIVEFDKEYRDIATEKILEIVSRADVGYGEYTTGLEILKEIDPLAVFALKDKSIDHGNKQFQLFLEKTLAEIASMKLDDKY